VGQYTINVIVDGKKFPGRVCNRCRFFNVSFHHILLCAQCIAIVHVQLIAAILDAYNVHVLYVFGLHSYCSYGLLFASYTL